VVRPPDGARSLAGYTLGPRVASDIYGDLHAATGDDGRRVQVLVVAPTLAADRAFADRLAHDAAPRLHAFVHPAVVGTVLVARDGRELVVVTEPTADARSVVDLLAAARGGLAPRVVAAIARAVVDGLAALHGAGLVHGAVHPRSVLLHRDGAVRLVDLAVGYAAMCAAAAGSEAMPLRGLTGFVAPEVALGDPPTAAADVYAAGALVHAMTSGEAPTGPLVTTPALERLVRRALDTDLTRRFASAVELKEDLADALEDDRVTPATAGELAALWADATAALAPAPPRGRRTTDAIDAATEDLLASLDGVVEVSRPNGGRVPAVAVAGRKLRTTNTLDAVLFELDDEPAAPPAAVLAGEPAVAPVEAPADPQPSPSPEPPTVAPPPPPAPVREPSVAASPEPVPDREPPPAPAEVPTSAPPAAGDAAPTRAEPAASAPVAAPVRAVTAAPPVAPRRRSFGWLWLAAIAAAAAVLAFGLTRQEGELSAAEEAARARKAAARAEQDELARRLRAAQADPGSLRVRSQPPGGGVWLLLGRAPFESIALRTDQAWELRVELEGYQPQDVRVGASGWQGEGDTRRASLALTLEPGAPVKPLPGLPAEPAADLARGVPGSGRLAVTTTPPGAAVWLLVGVSDSMSLDGIEAGRDYELKVTRDGYLPGFVRFAAEEWRAGGDPALPLSAAPKKSALERTVELVAAPRSGKAR
jgi:outer membrane biosynthesis protein TonB